MLTNSETTSSLRIVDLFCNGFACHGLSLRRDNVELHMQFQYEHEMGTTRLRLLVDNPDALYAEYQAKGVLHEGVRLTDTPWQTREFAIYDLDRNALTFYKPLPAPAGAP